MLFRLLAALVLSTAVSSLSRKFHLLTTGGAIAAALTGTIVLGWGGWDWAAVLIFFFVSSSLLTKIGSRRKDKLPEIHIQKSARDYTQVLANGLLPVLCVVAYAVTSRTDWFAIYLGTLACATADTWGTEIGLLSGKNPVLITTGRKVDPGVSGGITLPGIVASLAGGVSVALVGILANRTEFSIAQSIVIISVAGLAGSIIDSILGATLQARYQCQICSRATEQRLHCRQPTHKLSGLGWIDNNLVNLISGLISALLTFILISI